MSLDRPVENLNADYLFPNDNVIFELKSLVKNQADQMDYAQRLAAAMAHFGYTGSDTCGILFRGEPIPERVEQRLFSSMQNAMRNALRKANKQIIATKKLLGRESALGLLVVANDRDFGFQPLHALGCLSALALKLSNCHIDGIVYTTPNVFYDDGTDIARQYWLPVFAPRKEYFSDFVNPFGRAWLDHHERVAGKSMDRRQLDKPDSGLIIARPIDRLRRQSPPHKPQTGSAPVRAHHCSSPIIGKWHRACCRSISSARRPTAQRQNCPHGAGAALCFA